jgi:hypothetical protein
MLASLTRFNLVSRSGSSRSKASRSSLPGMLKGEDEFVLVGGVYDVAIGTV